MTSNATPDAVRTAISWVLAGFAEHDAFEPKLIHAIYDSKAAAIYNRLERMGAFRLVGDDDLASAFALGCSVGTYGEMTDEQEREYARLFPESETAQLVRLKQDAAARAGDGAT